MLALSQRLQRPTAAVAKFPSTLLHCLVGAYYIFLRQNKVRTFAVMRLLLSARAVVVHSPLSNISLFQAFFSSEGQGMAGIQRRLVMNLAFGQSSSNVDDWGHV